ncbi:Rieske 2Fe-2S domain-containing protein [Myxococcota bacterium]|nr:Rieske 2Fe-2S domain-containing protein [Myxococcota bacterium]
MSDPETGSETGSEAGSESGNEAVPGSGQRLPPSVPPVTRRSFLFRLGIGLNAIAASLMAVPIIGYVISATFQKRAMQAWIPLGEIDQFPERETRLAKYRNPFTVPWDGTTADIPCWVRRIDGQRFQIFAINCAHLGCPVRWFPQSGLFMCPCHGGVYYEDGSVASGPPPRGLYEYEYQIKNGALWVRGGQTPTLSEPV